MATGFYAISASAELKDLDLLFKSRTSTARQVTGFKVGANDLSTLFEPVIGDESDIIGFDTRYRSGSLDLRYIFQNINFGGGGTLYMLLVYSGSGTGNQSSASYAPITASVAPSHYHFNIWVGDTVVTPTSDRTTIFMDSDKVVSASYTINQWTLTVTNGTGDGTFDYDAAMPITASSISYQFFTNWSNPVGDLSFDDHHQEKTNAHFTADGDATAEAVYDWIDYTIQAVNGGGGADTRINGDGSGDPILLTNNNNYGYPLIGNAASYYHFVNWTGDTGSVENVNAYSTTLVVTADATVYSNFALNDYTITMQKDDGITSTTPAIGAHNYDYTGFPVNVSAVVEWDYDWAHWELDSSNVGGSNSGYNITAIGSHTMKAVSSLKNVAFDLADDGHGNPSANYTPWTPTHATVPIHTTVSITANPDTGYSFSSLTADKTSNISGYTCQLESTGVTTITVHYSINQYTLTVEDGTGGGAQNYGYSYNISADSKTGFTFSAWTGTGVSFGDIYDPTTTAGIGASDRTATANFNANSYTLDIANGTGGGAAYYQAPSGHQYSIYANDVPTGYSWGGWETNSGTVSYGNQASMDTTCYIGADNADISATYDINSYTLTVTFGTGGGYATYGHSYDIVANDYTGDDPPYVFDYWRKVSGDVSFGSPTNPSTTCTIGAGNGNIEAMYLPM